MATLKVHPSLQLYGRRGEEKHFSTHLPVAGARHHDSLWSRSLHPHLAVPALMGLRPLLLFRHASPCVSIGCSQFFMLSSLLCFCLQAESPDLTTSMTTLSTIWPKLLPAGTGAVSPCPHPVTSAMRSVEKKFLVQFPHFFFSFPRREAGLGQLHCSAVLSCPEY